MGNEKQLITRLIEKQNGGRFMKNKTLFKMLSVVLIVFLIIPYLSFTATALDAYSEEQLTEFENDDTTLPNTSGSCFITNVSSKRFLRKTDSYVVTTSTFQDIQDICWQFESIGNDRFNICAASNSAYALYGIGSDVEIDIVSGTPSFYYAWTIEPAVNGGFIITNCGGENVLCYDGTTLSLVYPRAPSDPDYDQTVWEFVESDKHILFIDHYYDMGFEARFSPINSNTKHLIQAYENVVSERLLSIFGLEVLSTYTSYTSRADSCKIETYGDNLADACNENCAHNNQYHTQSSTFRTSALRGSTISTTSIWTGHLLANNTRSNSSSSHHSIIITPYIIRNLIPVDEYEEIIAMQQTFTLIHELSHQIGAHDHYCYGKDQNTGVCSNAYCDTCHPPATPRTSCIMTERCDISTCSDENMYCFECRNIIASHLEGHH